MPSLASTIVAFALVASASAHLSLINIYGSNNRIGHAFGVNLEGKYPRAKGQPGDAGGDSGIFQTGTDNPNPPCGRTPELGELDIPSWLNQAEASGLPSAYSNMSVVIEAFQVNRDGGGPMTCEYNEDATATSWKPMTMTLNQAGNYGIQNQVRTNETVVMNFPENAICTGGFTRSACIVRCRTGVNKRFGGCFAVQLSGAPAFAQTVADPVVGTIQPPVVQRIAKADPKINLHKISKKDLNLIAEGIIASMKEQGLVVSASAMGISPSSLCHNITNHPDTNHSIKTVIHKATSTLLSPLAKESRRDPTTASTKSEPPSDVNCQDESQASSTTRNWNYDRRSVRAIY